MSLSHTRAAHCSLLLGSSEAFLEKQVMTHLPVLGSCLLGLTRHIQR